MTGGLTRSKLVRVWAALVALTAIEVVLAMQSPPVALFLLVLMGLSIVKAVMIIAYFMHLKYERRVTSLVLFPLLVVFILLLLAFLPDAQRIVELKQ